MIDSIDHIVLTVSNMNKTIDFYSKQLGMKLEEFTSDPNLGSRKCLKFGNQKINLHSVDMPLKGAHVATPGTADICFISSRLIEEWIKQFKKNSVEIELGPTLQVGATSDLKSIYIRDPDRNLIEISNKIES